MTTKKVVNAKIGGNGIERSAKLAKSRSIVSVRLVVLSLRNAKLVMSKNDLSVNNGMKQSVK
jgi:hypothetical protein